MNIKEIQDLIKFVSKSGVSEVEIEQKDFKITIKTPVMGVSMAMPTMAPVAMQVAAPAPVAAAPVAAPAPVAA